MKVLHVADFLPGMHRIAGGAEFATQRIIEEQHAMGIEVEVATLRPDGPSVSRPWHRYEMRNLDRYAARLAYAVKQLYFPGDPLARADLEKAIESSRPDVVHYHNLHYAGLSVVECARRAGLPSVWSIYDYWAFCPSFMLLTSQSQLCTRGHGSHCVDCVGARRLPMLRPLKQVLFGLREKAFARPVAAVDRLVVLSEASRDLLVRQGVEAERIVVLPQYIWKEAEAAPAVDSPVRGRLVYVGWVEQRKGLHVVVDALGRVAGEFPELHLDVLGMPANAEYEATILGMIEQRGLAGRVRFRGKVGRAELIQELQSAFLVVIPEQWENMSPVILTEAMAAGSCVLASRVGGIRQFVEEFRSGLLAERDESGEYAERIRWAMANPALIAQMGAAARDRARNLFAPDEINRRTLELYESLRHTRRVD